MGDVEVGTTLDGLVVEGQLGSGAMGVVYRAFDPRLQRPVAIKVISPEHAADPEFRQRFEREARMAAGIDHPHAVTVHSVGEQDGRLFLVTQFVDGTDLAELVRQRGPLEPATAVRLITQVGAALDAAHAKGLVHRDVKPANVLVGGPPGEPLGYLSDFGLTRPMSPGSAQLTSVGVLWGTPAFMAPELYEGDPAGVATDVYALGGTLYVALAGRVYRRGQSLVGALADHEVAVALDRVVRTALAADPAQRFPSAGALAAGATAAVAGGRVGRSGPGAAPPAGPVASTGLPAPRNPSPPPSPPPAVPAFGPRPAPFGSAVQGPRYGPPPASPVPASPTPASGSGPAGQAHPRASRGWLFGLLTVVVLAVAGGVLWWFATGAGTVSNAPAGTGAASVTLAPVRDDGDRVRLAWTGPELDYAIEVTPEGRPSTTVLAGRVDTATVAVEPGVRYCFRVRGTEGGTLVASNAQPVRGAGCPTG